MQMTRTTNGARSTKVCVLVVQNLPLVRFGLAKLIESEPALQGLRQDRRCADCARVIRP
jgi:hypothetical protein